MAAAAALAVGLRTAFMVLGCLITATVIYTVATDGLPFRKELLTPWMAATLVDFYINILAIGAWIIYKESNWIRSVIWIILLICLGSANSTWAEAHLTIWTILLILLGSITTCGYIVLQFLKLSPQESQQDPIYFVLLRNRKKDGTDSKRFLSIVSAKVLFTALGCLMLGTLIYTIATDGSPFRRDVLTPWLSATLIDFYVNVFALSISYHILFFFLARVVSVKLFKAAKSSQWGLQIILRCILGLVAIEIWSFSMWQYMQVWVAYKESNWKTAALWIILLICFGSISTCAYIVLQLFHLSSGDPVFLVLFSSNSRSGNGYEGTLQTEKYTAG